MYLWWCSYTASSDLQTVVIHVSNTSPPSWYCCFCQGDAAYYGLRLEFRLAAKDICCLRRAVGQIRPAEFLKKVSCLLHNNVFYRAASFINLLTQDVFFTGDACALTQVDIMYEHKRSFKRRIHDSIALLEPDEIPSNSLKPFADTVFRCARVLANMGASSKWIIKQSRQNVIKVPVTSDGDVISDTDEAHDTNHDQRNHTQASHVRTDVRKRQRQRYQNNGCDAPSKRGKRSLPLEHDEDPMLTRLIYELSGDVRLAKGFYNGDPHCRKRISDGNLWWSMRCVETCNSQETAMWQKFRYCQWSGPYGSEGGIQTPWLHQLHWSAGDCHGAAMHTFRGIIENQSTQVPTIVRKVQSHWRAVGKVVI